MSVPGDDLGFGVGEKLAGGESGEGLDAEDADAVEVALGAGVAELLFGGHVALGADADR